MRKRGVLFVLGLIAIFFFMAGGFGEADGTCYWEGNVEICSSIGYGEGPFRYLCGGPGERCCLGAGMQCWAGGVCVGGYCQQDCGYSFFDPESGFINYYCCINGLGF